MTELGVKFADAEEAFEDMAQTREELKNIKPNDIIGYELFDGSNNTTYEKIKELPDKDIDDVESVLVNPDNIVTIPLCDTEEYYDREADLVRIGEQYKLTAISYSREDSLNNIYYGYKIRYDIDSEEPKVNVVFRTSMSLESEEGNKTVVYDYNPTKGDEANMCAPSIIGLPDQVVKRGNELWLAINKNMVRFVFEITKDGSELLQVLVRNEDVLPHMNVDTLPNIREEVSKLKFLRINNRLMDRNIDMTLL